MPSTFFKVNLFFSAFKQGWSETYYYTGTNYTTALISTNILLNARQDCLCRSASLDYARITDEDNLRDSFLYKPQGMRDGNLNVRIDQSFTAVKLKIRNTNQYWRQLYIRGIPDDVSQPDIFDSPTNVPAFDLALTVFMSRLREDAAPWCLKVIDKANPIIGILNVDTPSVNRMRVTTPTAHGLAVGGFVKIYNLRSALKASNPPKPPGTLQVKNVVDSTNFDVQFAIPTGFVYSSTAKMRKVAYAYPKITTVDYDGITHRIVGRPFDLPVGRRRSAR